MMKVIMLAKEYPPNVYGGAGVHLGHLSHELAKLMKVEVRHFDEPTSKKMRNMKTELAANLSTKTYKFWDQLCCARDKKYNSAVQAISTNLSMICDNFDCSVVHTHTWYAHFAGHLAKLIYNIPFVATCHSIEPLRPWKQEQLGEAYYLSSWLEKVGLESADKIIAVSKTMKRDILKYFNVPEHKIEIIYNGIDLDKWTNKPISAELRKKFNIKNDYILFVGRPTKQKGMEYLIEAADQIPPEIQVVMAASGADTAEYEEQIRKKIETRKNIVWINEFLNEDEYIQLYSSARIFVCPSVYEPFGIINLEAMACKTPIVASAVGGIKEVVMNEETGILVEPKNIMQLADSIRLLLKNPALAKEYGESGRKRVERYFGWNFIAEQTKRLYEDLA